MTQFINKKEHIVTEAIDGLLLRSGSKLARLDGYPHIKVVLRQDWDKSQVALISGGGSGHEPAHPGFVGKGMLTAAVCGEVFASPSVEAVFSAIVAVTGTAGCLLIVKNYTGDRLNFGLAAEKAIALGFRVNMVIVGDDIALPDLAQPRGIAGTLFVHKIAGAMSENGENLESITKTAANVAENTKSIGMSLDTCTVPGSPKEERVQKGYAELGLGIHGEPGFETFVYKNAKQAVSVMLEKLAPIPGETYVVLLNNLGGLSVLEMSILCKEILESPFAENFEYIIGPESLMTAIDMRGFSISICPLKVANKQLLTASCAPTMWPGCQRIDPIVIVDLPKTNTSFETEPSENKDTEDLIKKCCEALIRSEVDLNALDAKSGDGDTGSTVASAGRSIISALPKLPLADNAKLYKAIGQELSQVMGGSSGVLLAIFFIAVGEAIDNGLSMTDALKSGLEKVQYVGGASPGDRTMIDALKPALDKLDDGFEAAAVAARQGANYTSMITKAKAGRSSYVNEKQLKGNNDPGAEAVAILFEFLNSLKNSE